MYHPEASIVRVGEVHAETAVSRGAQGIRETMAAYIGLKPHMDVVTHHTTVGDGFAMTRSQWLITGVDKDGRKIEVHHHGMEVHRRLPDGTWVFFLRPPFGPIRPGPSTGRPAPTDREGGGGGRSPGAPPPADQGPGGAVDGAGLGQRHAAMAALARSWSASSAHSRSGPLPPG